MARKESKIRRLRELYYITHIDNIPSILQNGILSHELIISKKVKYTRIYDEEIVSSRKNRFTPNGKNLWSLANLYFNVRNPMLYRVVREKSANNLAVIGVNKNILRLDGVFVSKGNAASPLSEILKPSTDVLFDIIKETEREWWNEQDGSKRQIMAECLVPDFVPPQYIQSIYFSGYDVMYKMDNKIRDITRIKNITLSPEPKMFFQPIKESKITQLLSIIEGDMFFSNMQTLTVSVNCVGVMGKGIASRAKYQFPDVYVKYQDLCRNYRLKLGKPYLYKREISFDHELADHPESMSNFNSETWFLLFPTKHNWRDQASINGIEEGLKWICDNYKKEGIKSLALPALGCGLGWLEWKDVGPLLCKYLSTLDIEVKIYLPTEKETPNELISREFLLGSKGYQNKLS